MFAAGTSAPLTRTRRAARGFDAAGRRLPFAGGVEHDDGSALSRIARAVDGAVLVKGGCAGAVDREDARGGIRYAGGARAVVDTPLYSTVICVKARPKIW